MDTTFTTAMGAAIAVGTQLGRKFVEADMTPELRTAATEYALRYNGTFDWLREQRPYAVRRSGLSDGRAKGVLNCLMAEARRLAVRKTPGISVEDAGVYVLPDGAICKVKVTKNKDHTYAERWTVIGGERLTEAETRVHGEYVYEPRLIHQVAAEGRKMTLTEAKAFILRYGVCCRCGTKLVAADSVERGIGPVCKGYFAAGTSGAELMVGGAAARQMEAVS
jgi:hypothetical protein